MEALTIEEIIEIYNPAKAKELTEEQVNGIQHLMTEHIKALAEAYPNTSNNTAYLVYKEKDVPLEKQRFPLGTWKNLLTLHEMGKTNYQPYKFRANMPAERKTAVKLEKVGSTSKQKLDLSDEEAMRLKNLKITTGGNKDNKGQAPVIPPADVTKDVTTGTGSDNIPAPKEIDEANPLVIAFREAVTELNQLKTDKAHHMTIKSQEAKVTAAAEAATTEGFILEVPVATAE